MVRNLVCTFVVLGLTCGVSAADEILAAPAPRIWQR